MTVTQETFDATLAQFGVFGESVTFHNATLHADEPGPDGGIQIALGIGDCGIVVRTPGRYDSSSTEFLKREIGKVGCAVRANELVDGRSQPQVDAVFFRPYLDQSLQRRPEIDCEAPKGSHRNEAIIGWSCDARGLFLAPAGIIPGEGGQYVPDTTVPLTLFIPEAFTEVCEDVGLSAEQVLRGFIADAASLHSYAINPRADRYSTNGSDERGYAEDYIERAWGHNREEAAKWKEYRQQSQDEQELFDEAMDRIRELAAEQDIAFDRLADTLEEHFGTKDP